MLYPSGKPLPVDLLPFDLLSPRESVQAETVPEYADGQASFTLQGVRHDSFVLGLSWVWISALEVYSGEKGSERQVLFHPTHTPASNSRKLKHLAD